ncbi:hypothetical protein [Streptomyces atroolivaceus]|uniref:hypothetical protein n=1 Tax=Streptomyces atroolivaceus TaxID=66869 RepID=UPI003439D73F
MTGAARVQAVSGPRQYRHGRSSAVSCPSRPRTRSTRARRVVAEYERQAADGGGVLRHIQ